jgi:hypothetical protein
MMDNRNNKQTMNHKNKQTNKNNKTKERNRVRKKNQKRTGGGRPAVDLGEMNLPELLATSGARLLLPVLGFEEEEEEEAGLAEGGGRGRCSMVIFDLLALGLL